MAGLRGLKRRADAPTARDIAFSDDGDNDYADQVRSGHGVDPRTRVIIILGVVLVVLYVFGLIVPKNIINTGLNESGVNKGYTLSWFVDALMANVNDLVAVVCGSGSTEQAVPLCTLVIVALTGAGMAMCGSVYQGTFKNALVSPSTLGVMSGASLGMTLWVLLFVADDAFEEPWTLAHIESQGPLAYLWDMYGLAICSFVGCILVVFLVVASIRIVGGGRTSGIMMIVTGQVLGAVMGALTNTARYFYVETNPEGLKAQLLQELQIASFYRSFTIVDILAVGIPLLLTFLLIMRLRQKMMALSFDEAEARTMGVDVKLIRYGIIALCTLTTAIIVSFCGHVGFVGFLVPHMARRLVGPNFRYLLPAATLLGAVFVLAAYLVISITLGPDYETMTGMFISILGATIFLVTALGGKGGAQGEFR